jgi:hypothetical protein
VVFFLRANQAKTKGAKPQETPHFFVIPAQAGIQ